MIKNDLLEDIVIGLSTELDKVGKKLSDMIGKPVLTDELPELIKYAREQGFSEGIYNLLTGDGTVIDHLEESQKEGCI